MLIAHGSEIGGEPREFPYKATRANGLWWITEEQMQDIAFRRGFDKVLYDSMFESYSKSYSMEYENLSMENPPAEPADAARPMAATTRTVTRVGNVQNSGAAASSSSSKLLL